jgi:antirestriction protein ArdC
MATTTTRARKARKTYSGPTPEEKLCTALVELLERGVNPWRREWAQLGQQGQHRNLLTGAAYRGSNPAVLEMWSACRGFSLPLWLGVAQAKGEGWHPRKGSSGCYVLRPQLNRREQTDDDGKPVTGPDGTPLVAAWVSFKPVCVFNVADLVGTTPEAQQALEARIAQALGAVTVRTEPERIAAAEAVLGAWPVPTSWGGDRACYSPSADRISMPTREQFSTAAGLYATWAHEQAHSTGHSSRLDRDLSGSHGSEAYAREELVAELAAFLICNRLEIPSSTENHAAYLGSWARALKEGPRVLFKALGDASKAAAAICGPDVTDSEA